ncbi:hypothetical protein [Dyella choica]|uniref:Uncharacterized protein n=1 Tax=Dyella choica TaxID=1927959 RepID=A0A3S0R6F0_9GAMM|nr:hypothetical protein [Dyella choica]RUL79928.1 hypothetical protein EKH80_01685 [Dyella choica]
MSEEAAIAAFRRALLSAFEFFQAEEQNIRSQYARDVDSGNAPPGADDDELLERPTRRFLVDRMLRALDWNPDDPNQVGEEVRSWDQEGERLYFDYLGISSLTRTPVVLVEAKAYDKGAPRKPHGASLDARSMTDLISGAIADLKSGRKEHSILAEWITWLSDLRDYVSSLSELGRSTLRRVVSTAGQWVVVFEEPVMVFLDDGPPPSGFIHCFVSFTDIFDRSATLFQLLHRPRLVDTLPLLFTRGDAAEFLAPHTIAGYFRGVLVATRESGPRRRHYPTRTLLPALVVISVDRPFAIVDFGGGLLEDPLDPTKLPDVIQELVTRGSDFERQLLQMLGRLDLVARPLLEFPGFCSDSWRDEVAQPTTIAAVAAAGQQVEKQAPRFVIHVGERYPEYLVVTGEHWFYKTATPLGSVCKFHDWPHAKENGVAAEVALAEKNESSYTVSGEDIHCAHEVFRRLRIGRCKVDVLDAHLCCRACIYSPFCWSTDVGRLPCPP